MKKTDLLTEIRDLLQEQNQQYTQNMHQLARRGAYEQLYEDYSRNPRNVPMPERFHELKDKLTDEDYRVSYEDIADYWEDACLSRIMSGPAERED